MGTVIRSPLAHREPVRPVPVFSFPVFFEIQLKYPYNCIYFFLNIFSLSKRKEIHFSILFSVIFLWKNQFYRLFLLHLSYCYFFLKEIQLKRNKNRKLSNIYHQKLIINNSKANSIIYNDRHDIIIIYKNHNNYVTENAF